MKTKPSPKPKTRKVVKRTIKGRALIDRRFAGIVFCAVPDDPMYHGKKNMVVANVRSMLDVYKLNLKLVACTISYLQ